MIKDNVAWPVWTGTLYLVVYLIVINFSPSSPAPMLMFACSPFIVIWMAVYILKHGKPSGRTFDEYFYDDEKWKRSERN